MVYQLHLVWRNFLTNWFENKIFHFLEIKIVVRWFGYKLSISQFAGLGVGTVKFILKKKIKS